jgi:glycosyltransferase involved in cell wall biosynthesis
VQNTKNHLLKYVKQKPICRYLEDIVKSRYPTKSTEVLYQGIDPAKWYPVEPMSLNHPCVGLLQGAWIWGKAKEMLTLEKVLESMPNVTFYWAGDGPYKNNILEVLGKYKNFKWLGSLQYPDKVREYLSAIDVYALISGLDMSPLTLQEAQLMKKPVIATRVGGIPELMVDNKTGFLVDKGNHKMLIEKISFLLDNPEKAKEMGVKGREFVVDNFSWDVIAKRFADIMKKFLS